MIGTGGIAQSQHLPNLSRARHATLKTVCDLREEVLKKVQAQYRIPEAVTDYRTMLADPEIDAVVVATREDMQAPLTVEALKAGKHVYVEKPLANTPEEVETVVAAQRQAGKHVSVGFNRRFAPAYVKAKELVHADGGPKNIHYRISDEYWRWGKNYPPNTRVIHEVCHIFDILRWFTDSDPQSIYCVGSRPDDEAYVLKFKNGCVATIMNSGYCTMDLPKERIEIVSNLGSVIVEEFVELRTYGYKNCDWIHRFPGHSHPDREFTHKFLLGLGGAEALYQLRRMGWEQRARFEKTDGEPEPDRAELQAYCSGRCPHWNYMVDKGWLAAVDHLAECILTGQAPRNACAADGLWSAKMSSAAISSRETGRVVEF
ncbi:MAG: hypothetical protein A3K19_33085 [Lentisphaerae bacterium RIFOXYB12_FULL_65_16]|nr:MAG: hypothetical protein A3K18_19365 [Lentisphaerae bacterium RIFOXYA12_64_32]OGV87020.1 MAG: hypothetical protein A3K19_33085 [Lentisphaerae bacterium RIFOXYB12_FULL_65_16]